MTEARSVTDPDRALRADEWGRLIDADDYEQFTESLEWEARDSPFIEVERRREPLPRPRL